MLLDGVIALDADLLCSALLVPVWAAAFAEAGHSDRVALHLELVAGGVILEVAAGSPRIAVARIPGIRLLVRGGRSAFGLLRPWGRISVAVDDAPSVSGPL